jgi:predicted enzyme related to lactoylglutathione lyase
MTAQQGSMTHIEIPADDVERAKRFYNAVAGWDFQEMEGYADYWLFQSEPQRGGAIGSRGSSVGPVVRHYVNVDRVEDAVERAEANGGEVVETVQEVPGQGRWAVVLDSEGNELGLWQDLT